MQLVVFAVRLAAGMKLGGAAILADMTQGVSWAVIVCLGVAIGVSAERSRALLGGVLGAISGPIGWGIAKSLQRIVQAATGAAIDQFTPLFFLLTAVKGVEYLILGWALGRLADRKDTRLRDYALPGAVLGVVTGMAVIALNLWHGPMPLPKILGLAASELTFPIGCALVIYAPVHMRRFAGLT
ncbi:MAG: hypothetical protein JOZ72_01235 [Alphaproteobacteria bacterium]|nr:hypothetical protein [Alphaproteobacteria bacterium]